MNQDSRGLRKGTIKESFTGQPPDNQYHYNQKWLRVTDLSWFLGGLSEPQQSQCKCYIGSVLHLCKPRSPKQDLGDPVPTSAGMLLARLGSWNGAAAPPLTAISRAVAWAWNGDERWSCAIPTSQAVPGAWALEMWMQTPRNHLTWSLIPSLHQFAIYEMRNKSSEALPGLLLVALHCCFRLALLQGGHADLQLSRWYVQSQFCKKCPMFYSVSPCCWYQLQSALH